MKFTYKDFLIRATAAHGSKYDYNKVEFINTTTKVTITCPVHGDFSQTPFKHYTTSGCPHCGAINSGLSRSGKPTAKRHTQEHFLQKVQKVHKNNYTYEKTVYTTANDKLVVTCKYHGDFTIIASKHIQGQGCKKCATKATADTQRKTLKQFIDEANATHKGKYSYEKSNYISNKKNLVITCPIHGDFSQSPAAHVCNKHGCPKCANETQGFKPERYSGKPTIFYVLELQNGLFKPGITTQNSIEKRYNQDNYTSIVKTILFQVTFKDGKEARQFEIDILNQFKQFKFKGPQVFPKVKNTEILTINPVEAIIKKLITSQGYIMDEMNHGNMQAYKLDNK